MDNDLISQVTALVMGHAWVPLAALAINLLVRQLRSDAWLPINISPRWRSMVALGLGIVSGVLQAGISGTPWADAIVGGIISAAFSVLGHETVVNGIANGKQVMPRFGKSKAAKMGLLALVFLVTGCGGSFEEVRTAAIAQHRSMVTLGAAVPARDQHHCDSLDNDHTLFVRAAWIDGIVSGATGAAAGVIQGTDDATRNWRIGLGVTAGVTAGLAVGATALANSAATTWAADCGSGP